MCSACNPRTKPDLREHELVSELVQTVENWARDLTRIVAEAARVNPHERIGVVRVQPGHIQRPKQLPQRSTSQSGNALTEKDKR